MVVRKMELESQATEVLKALGISKGHIALDFGCDSHAINMVILLKIFFALERMSEDEIVQKARGH